MKEKIIVITGPTGVGKTKISIELAKDLNGEIISCDAYQIYRGMDIGTDKIDVSEMLGVVHHNLDIINPDEYFNSFMFREITDNLINDITKRGKTPILVGGTGLYLHSLIHEMNFGEVESSEEIKNEVQKELKDKGIEFLYSKLKLIDKEIENIVNPNNTHRVIRAYEIYKATNEPPSKYLSNFREKNKKYNYLFFVLNNDREVLYDNINLRVDKMMTDGLLNEIKGLLNKNYSFDMQSLKGIGYKEFRPYFEGKISLEEAVSKVKQHSRNFAKRQLTWFKREDDAIWINKNEFSSDTEIKDYLIKRIEEFLTNDINS